MVWVNLFLVNVMQMDVLRVDMVQLYYLCCDKLENNINYFLCKHMLVFKAAGFIYRNEGLKLAKSLFKSVTCLDAFELQGDYRIGEAFLGGS